MQIRWVLFSLGLAITVLPAVAEDPTGVLEGQITNPSGATVPNGIVTASNSITGIVATEQSTQDGAFIFSSLPVGAGVRTVDVSLFKSFGVTERAHLQFRAECFNCLNHANFGLPENDLESPAFGQILQGSAPRLMQLALKFVF